MITPGTTGWRESCTSGLSMLSFCMAMSTWATPDDLSSHLSLTDATWHLLGPSISSLGVHRLDQLAQEKLKLPRSASFSLVTYLISMTAAEGWFLCAASDELVASCAIVCYCTRTFMHAGSGQGYGHPVCGVQLFRPTGLHGHGQVLQGLSQVLYM